MDRVTAQSRALVVRVARHFSSIAQLVEHLTVNQAVPGSNPGRGAIFEHTAEQSNCLKQADE